MTWKTSDYRLYVGGYNGAIVALRFNPQDATITQIGRSNFPNTATTLELSPLGDILYCVDEWGSGKNGSDAYALRVDRESGQIADKPIDRPVHFGEGTSSPHGSLTPDGKYFVVSSYRPALVHSIPLLPSGAPDPTQCETLALTGQVGPKAKRQDAPHPHAATCHPAGRYVVVPDLGSDDIRLFRLDGGRLSELPSFKMSPGDGPRHVTFDRNGELLYCLNELSSSITLLSFSLPPNAEDPPTLKVLQTTSLLPPKPFPHEADFSTWHASELALSPDRRIIHACNRHIPWAPLKNSKFGPGDVLATFALDPASGAFIGEATFTATGRTPRDIAMSPDGHYVAVACHDGEVVIIYERVSEGRELKEVARFEDGSKPAKVLWV